MAVSNCCFETAADTEAVFCGECGKTLMRCMAHDECGGVLDEDGLCDICVRPALFLDAGAALDVKAGGAQVLPLIFSNVSPRRRPLFISQVWVREGRGDRRVVEAPWERLEPGASNPLWVQTGPVETSGRQRVELIISATTRLNWRKETFAFLANLELSVEQGGGLVINQTINTGGGGTGSDTVYAPIRLEGALDNNKAAARGTEPSPLLLVRAERFDRTLGLRGYSEGALADAIVARNARLTWRGFPANEAPAPGPITSHDGLLAMGRAATRAEGGAGDVRLLVRDAAGKIDEPLSLAISRNHIDLFVQGGQLCLHAAGEAGLVVNEARLTRGAIQALEPGDIVRVLPKYPDALAFEVGMRANHGVVEDVVITRIPALREG